MIENESATGLEIAIIGMAGRFPAAGNIEEYWENIKNGRDCIPFYSDQELEESGLSPEIYNRPDYVKSNGGIIEGLEYFDADFFGYTSTEAELLDPQLRLFHECCWEALEDAGYDPGSYEGLIGLFGGAEDNNHWREKVLLSTGNMGAKQTRILISSKDFVTARVSYKFDLKGPVFTLITGCSTALTSIHLASRSLIGGECDIVLAGGVHVHMFDRPGRIYQEGMLESSDGHLRAFDARASGTIFSDGAGIVVLKLLEDALADNDHIYAVIKGSAVNCDGNRKVNFTAPSVKGQADVIKAAYQAAGVEMESIGYLETHGTGTPLGDPIEINALRQAFNTRPGWRCPIGSVKTNIGHLDVASGAAGLIKTVLILIHKLIPPTINFETPNPKLELEKTPFYVNTELTELKSSGGPLRAAVSSFGFGGTNVHAILEEVPQSVNDENKTGREYQLILLSAKTPSALEKMSENLVNFLKEDRVNPGNPVNPGQNPDLILADAAYTLQVGRQPFQYRKFCVCSNPEEAVHSLPVSPEAEAAKKPPVIFMFSGQGSQYINMGLEIYCSEPVFREHMDQGFDILKSLTGKDFKEIVYPDRDIVDVDDIQEQMNDAHNSGPIKLIFEYSLGKLLIHWGIRPHAVIGHSFGEYTAACLAGVFSFRDALELALLRGELMLRTPPGGMMSIPSGQEQLSLYLETHPDISLAAVNSSSLCFVSGPPVALEHLEKDLEEKGIECMGINFPRAAHSYMMKSITGEFEKKVRTIKLQEPTIPFMSCLTADWLSPGQITDPGYWAKHLEQPVRFCQVVEKLLEKPRCIFVQVGPDRGLPLFVNQHRRFKPETLVTNLVRHKKDNIPDMVYFLKQLGALWLHGVRFDWPVFHANQQRRRISLPTYPFEGKRYWIDIDFSAIASDFFSQQQLKKRKNVSHWLYTSSWKRSPIPTPTEDANESIPCLIFTDANELGTRLAGKLEEKGHTVMIVKPGEGFEKENPRVYRINPTEGSDYDRLFKALKTGKKIPRLMIHLWNVTGAKAPGLNSITLGTTLDLGLYSLLHIVQSMGRLGIHEEMHLEVITDNMQSVIGEEILYPAKAASLGAVWVIPLEYPNVSCHSLDIILPEPGSPQEEELLQQLLAVITHESFDETNPVMAIRGDYSWIQTYEPIKKPRGIPSQLRQRGVYLITGGLGGIGFVLAEHLVKTVKARLILTGRSQLPPRDQWQQWLDTHPEEDHVSQRIKKVRNLEKLGAEVLVFSADSADQKQMQEVVTRAKEHFGQVNGIIHTAGLVDYYGVIQNRTREMTENILAPKVKGTMILDHLTRDTPLDFFVICSSIASLIPGFGEVGYAAANMFIDAFAHYKKLTGKIFTTAVNWDTWQEVGAAVESVKRQQQAGKTSFIRLEDGIRPTEGWEVFTMILGNPNSQVVVSTKDLGRLLDQHRSARAGEKTEPEKNQETVVSKAKKSLRPRPALNTSYVTPANPTQRTLAEIWQDYFGIDRVGIRDDFFELGGDSLMATIMAARIHKRMNVRIPLTEIFQGPTVELLSQYIKSREEEEFQSIPLVEKREYYPLSPAQKRLFILQQFEAGLISYNSPDFFILEGEIDKERLNRSLGQMIQRHESLRTTFEMTAGGPVQRVADFIDSSVEYYTANEEEAGIIVKDFVRPFDLGSAPLLRVGLIKNREARHIYMFDMHHIITDGTSLEIFANEFLALYAGGQLPLLTIQYKDFAEWQIHLLQSGEIKKQEQYWLKEFTGEIPILELPTDYPRPEMQSYEGRMFQVRLSPEDTRGMNRLSREQDVTLYMTILAVIKVFLFKLSGQETIIVGISTAGRQHEDLQHIIGMFVNTLVIKSHPLGDKGFVQLLQEIKSRSLAAFENQDYPFEELVENLKLNRDMSRNPMFDVMFSFQNYAAPPMDIPLALPTAGSAPLQKKAYPSRNFTSRFDITFFVTETSDFLLFNLEYCTKLFKQETLERFGNYLKKVVSTILDNPAVRLAEVEIIGEQERQQILYDFNQTDVEFPGEMTIHELFARQVEQIPHQIAIVGPSVSPGEMKVREINQSFLQQITYNQLHEKSDRMARLLEEKGAKPGTIVGILVERTVQMITGLLGILKTGAAYLPLDPGYPEARIKYIIEKSNITILLTRKNLIDKYHETAFAGKIFDVFARDLYSEPGSQRPIRPGRQVIPTEEMASSSSTYDCSRDRQKPEEKSSNDSKVLQYSNIYPAYVIYTSGSTGNPKGVVVNHKNAINFITGMTAIIDFSPGKTILALTTVSFDIFFLEMILPLTCGMKVVIGSEEQQRDPGLLAAVLMYHKVNILQITPSRLQSLLIFKGDLEYMQGIDTLLVGGEAFPAALFKRTQEKFPGKIYNVYGPTETTIWSTVKDLTRCGPRELTIGTPIANTQVYIVDRQLKLQPLGVPGGLVIGGDGVAMGYLNNVELTAEKFINFKLQIPKKSDSTKSKVYSTGDLARWLANGEIEFLGRLDQQVKIRGFRIELEEIEEQLLKHKDIDEAVVISRNDKRDNIGGHYLCAYITGKKTVEKLVDSTGLKEHLSRTLPYYMIPSYFVPLDRMPLTPNGKIDRKALPRPDSSQIHLQAASTTSVSPRTKKEKMIAAAWKEILQVEEVGIYDNFFNIGGNSLNVIRLNQKLKEVFGKEIPLTEMFKNLTIHFLDQYLSEDKRENEENKYKEEMKQTEILDKAKRTITQTINKFRK